MNSTPAIAILIVDDDSVIRTLLNKFLSKNNYRLAEAESGEQAVLRCQSFKPDVILMDVNMPGMDGFATCRAIRQLAMAKYTAIIMLTGMEDPESIDMAYDSGASDFMVKPINFKLLNYRIQYNYRNSQDLVSLHRSETSLSLSQTIAQMGGWSYDVNHKQLTWSQELYQLCNISPDNPIASKQHLLEFIDATDRERMTVTLEDCFTKQKNFNEIYQINIAGETRYFHEVTQDFSDEEGKTSFILGAVQDITDLKKAEQALQKLNHELEQRVIKRTEQLQATNSELQETLDILKSAQKQLVEAEKMASLGGLVAGVAHEINTPLGIALTSSSFLTDEFKQLASHITTYSSEQLSQALDDCATTTHLLEKNLLQTSRLVSSFKSVAVGQSNEVETLFDLRHLLDDLVSIFSPQLNKQHINVVLECPTKTMIMGYSGALIQIFNNLVSNSLTHGFADQSSGTITIRVERDDNTLILHYADDGIGLSKEVLGKIYEPFFTTKRGTGNIGLGMHIVYNLVTQLLQGQIQCGGETGKGFTATIQFPCTEFGTGES